MAAALNHRVGAGSAVAAATPTMKKAGPRLRWFGIVAELIKRMLGQAKAVRSKATIVGDSEVAPETQKTTCAVVDVRSLSSATAIAGRGRQSRIHARGDGIGLAAPKSPTITAATFSSTAGPAPRNSEVVWSIAAQKSPVDKDASQCATLLDG